MAIPTVKFNKNGKLKIMHITDTHLDHDNIDMSLYLIEWACKKEMPAFNEKYLEYGDEIQFLMIDFATDDKIEDVKKYISEMGFEFPVFYDIEGDASSVYDVWALPTTIFVDADGYIMDRVKGTLTEEKLQAGIDKILG